jgi:hypothetical protein
VWFGGSIGNERKKNILGPGGGGDGRRWFNCSKKEDLLYYHKALLCETSPDNSISTAIKRENITLFSPEEIAV